MSIATQIRQNTYDQLVDYATANPTKLLETYKTRPGGTPATPFAYVDSLSLAWVHPGSTLRQLTGEVAVVFATDVVDNVEAKDELYDAAQGFTDQVAALPHYIGSNTVWETISVEDESISVGAVEYTAVVITIGGITIQEGGF